MNNNLDFIFPVSNSHNIFSGKDIYIDNSNLNIDMNFDIGDANIKNNFEPFDNLFNNKNSRISSYDENEFQKIVLKPHTLNNEVKNIYTKNEIPVDLSLKENINKKRRKLKIEENFGECKEIKDKEKNNLNKTVKFHSYKLNVMTEEEKVKQRDKNKISARKSRLKKKQYIAQLEKEYSSLKSQLGEIKQNLGINENIISNSENEEFLLNTKGNYCSDCSKIENLKIEENMILNSENIDEKSNLNLINSYTEKQKKILEKLLINQIIIMMPIKIKIFQDKYLKLFSFNKEDSLNVVKNKIERNLKTIQELYDINNLNVKENGIIVEQHYKKINKNGSMANQIYDYYYNLKNYINGFEQIYLSLI